MPVNKDFEVIQGDETLKQDSEFVVIDAAVVQQDALKLERIATCDCVYEPLKVALVQCVVLK